jgi:integrase/recombinase XerD
LQDLLDNYRDWLIASGASADTVKGRVFGARKLLRTAQTSDPCKITPQHLVTVLAAAKARWTKATYYNHAVNFAAYCAFAGLQVNFLTGVIKPRVPRGLPRPIDVTEFRQALTVATPDVRMMFLLAAYVGLRVHEIAKVRGEDVRGGQLFTIGKGTKDAYVPLHAVLVRHAEGFPSVGWWFPNADDSGPIGRGTVWRRMHLVLQRVGSTATPHQVRHLYGTTLVLTGSDLRTAQELLRHASLTSTQIYTDVGDERLRAAIARLPDYTAEIA